MTIVALPEGMELPDEVIFRIVQFTVNDLRSVCILLESSNVWKPLNLAMTCKRWSRIVNSPLLIKPCRSINVANFVAKQALTSFTKALTFDITYCTDITEQEFARFNYMYINGCTQFIGALFKFQAIEFECIKVCCLHRNYFSNLLGNRRDACCSGLRKPHPQFDRTLEYGRTHPRSEHR